MCLKTSDLVQGYIYLFGVWEPNLTCFLKARLASDPSRVFVDVGANVGYFSLLAARLLSEGKVVSIEAHPDIFKRLEDNVALNEFSNIECVNAAVSDSQKKIEIFYAGSSNEGATSANPIGADGNGVLVDANKLSDLLSDLELSNVKAIKIDVEGAEHAAIVGMTDILDKLSDDAEIFLEISPQYLSTSEIHEILSILRKHGFNAYILTNVYSPEFYIDFDGYVPARRVDYLNLENKLSLQVDLIFSRIDADVLEI